MLQSRGVDWKGALGDRRGIHLLLQCEAVEELEGVGVFGVQLAARGKHVLEWQGLRTKKELQIP
jgi:hypothetical protein